MTDAVLAIAEDLHLPAVEAAAQRFAWIGASGSGKTYGCGRYVEEAHEAHIPVIILDTVNAWPPIRLAADGKSPGLPFSILGGDHADVPLDLRAGEKLARFLISTNASAVLDLSDYAPEERAPFVADFCDHVLIALKHQQQRRPRFVVYDEAQDLAPQVAGKGESRMIKSVSALIRKGRNHLCGTVLLTQRPADLNKAALNLCGNLFVGGLFASHDRKAMRDWAGSKARSVSVEAQLKDLPGLQPGEFYFWSPSWRKTYQKVTVLPKWTFDGSSSTPLPSDAELGKVAPVDVAALARLLASAPLPTTILPPEKTSSPASSASLVDRFATAGELEARQVAAVNTALEERLGQLETELQRLLVRDRDQTDRLSRYEEVFSSVARSVKDEAYEVENSRRRLEFLIVQLSGAAPTTPFEVRGPGIDPEGRIESEAQRLERKGKPRPEAVRQQESVLRATDNPYHAAVLATIATYGPLDRQCLSLLSGKSRTSSTFAEAIRMLIAQALITEVDRQLKATREGLVRAGVPPLPTGQRLFEHYLGKLSPYDRKTFETLAKYLAGLTRAELSERTGHSRTSSTFADSIRTLKVLGLCEEVSGRVRLKDHVRKSMGLK